ncbi:MAG: hypothetical protein SVR04_17365 [Spirochaetota bacterium]|nr:hypothetical protein [Spirochaetota bacterium]
MDDLVIGVFTLHDLLPDDDQPVEVGRTVDRNNYLRVEELQLLGQMRLVDRVFEQGEADGAWILMEKAVVRFEGADRGRRIDPLQVV